MLPHIGNTDSIIVCCLGDLVHHFTHFDLPFFGIELIPDNAVILFFCIWLELRQPFSVRLLIELCRHQRQRLFGITHHLHCTFHILIDLCQVDIEVNHLRLPGICLQISRHTIIESHADGDQHIAFICLDVGCHVTMHPQHATVKRVIRGHRRQPQDG